MFDIESQEYKQENKYINNLSIYVIIYIFIGLIFFSGLISRKFNFVILSFFIFWLLWIFALFYDMYNNLYYIIFFPLFLLFIATMSEFMMVFYSDVHLLKISNILMYSINISFFCIFLKIMFKFLSIYGVTYSL